ncbi:MAG: prepilin-type N-terminal cleavage/methylation domain-containing protein [Nitrososphaeraceae archaeon]|nr:prepilin-type N-terminal cleavage/methylation domain-containing protein [Nitrososphaeraceae archaeon]MBV9667820.1 prepilin-type N-terminal cleavage/methylation domain-containing protein [Nitrososphaeraceae archaeon]
MLLLFLFFSLPELLVVLTVIG